MADDGRALLAGIESELTVRDRLDIAESELRRDLARTIMRWFVRVNVAVLLLLAVVYGTEANRWDHRAAGCNSAVHLEMAISATVKAAETLCAIIGDALG